MTKEQCKGVNFKRATRVLLLGGVLAVGAAACASAENEETVGESDESELGSKVLTKKDNGKTIAVSAGYPFELKLESNPSSGVKWSVASADRVFGSPYETYLAKSNRPGSPGTTTFQWSTQPIPFSLGKHSLTLQASGSPPQKFTVTLDVKPAKCANTHPVAFHSGATLPSRPKGKSLGFIATYQGSTMGLYKAPMGQSYDLGKPTGVKPIPGQVPSQKYEKTPYWYELQDAKGSVLYWKTFNDPTFCGECGGTDQVCMAKSFMLDIPNDPAGRVLIVYGSPYSHCDLNNGAQEMGRFYLP